MGAVIFPLLVVTMALVVDAGRLYAVQAKAQNASDAALMGGVATMNTTDLQTETVRLFNANYPAHYMGSTVGPITTTNVAPGVYEATYTVTVPTTVTGVFSDETVTLNMLSQVTKGIDTTGMRRFELSMVLDNTGSMEAGDKIGALKIASHTLVNILFGDAASLDNLHISVVPYDIVVNVGPYRSNWIQPFAMWKYLVMAGGGIPYPRPIGFAFNRETDFLCGPYPIWLPEKCWDAGEVTTCNPETGTCTTTYREAGCRPAQWGTTSECSPNGLNDVSDAPPLTADTKFRLPYEEIRGDHPDDYTGVEKEYHKYITNLAPLRFGLNDKASVHAAIDAMRISGATRIPVGLMWGWFTLSPRWQGLWDSAKPDLPANPHARLTKALILMTDGKNVWKTTDDSKTLALCNAIKASGIVVYTVGFGTGSDVNVTLLQSCATLPSYFWLAPTAADLEAAFSAIADDILHNTLRLSK